LEAAGSIQCYVILVHSLLCNRTQQIDIYLLTYLAALSKSVTSIVNNYYHRSYYFGHKYLHLQKLDSIGELLLLLCRVLSCMPSFNSRM